MHNLKYGLQRRCVPAIVGPWMYPVLSTLDCSSRQPLSVSVSSLTRHDRLCNPSWASSRALARASMRFQCRWSPCCSSDARPLGHSRSRCGPALSFRRSGRPGGERSQVWPSVKLHDSSPRWSGLLVAASQFPLVSSSPTPSFGVPQSLSVRPSTILLTLWSTWRRALSIVALCQTVW